MFMVRRFYDAFKEALEITGITAAQACAMAEVSPDQIKKLMQRGAKGERASTNVEDAMKLANALGFTLDELLQDDTAALRSEAAALWRSLSNEERGLLRAVARGRDGDPDPSLEKSS